MDGGMEMAEPTVDMSVRDLFGIDSDMTVKGFAEPTDRVPDIDTDLPLRPRHDARDPRRLRRSTAG